MSKRTIGNKLRELRGDRSQNEIAQECGVTAMAISQYERDERIPRDEIKIKLARLFNTSVENIFYNQE